MFFSELKKYFHKTEGNELKHAAVAHTNHAVIYEEQKLQTRVPTLDLIQTSHKTKLDPKQLIFLS